MLSQKRDILGTMQSVFLKTQEHYTCVKIPTTYKSESETQIMKQKESWASQEWFLKTRIKQTLS